MSKKSDSRSSSSQSDQAEALDFEAALEQLESLVEALESGDLALADSLEHFEKGIRLSRRCHELIDGARQKVSLLSDPDQEDRASDFKPESAETSD
ncbi:exodeoxyribonuclease VII small subunit [Wenzhouxiangella marina]|uniref:exodeoxyribonuclease VII small subunit n=1 Tax=Wenzhouxiangella marina TaxID=1579979 RepID=UPI00067349F7|nr:exodeoxyribonuclease VII small subunit [Wenzhouxiangella marina]MBB6086148.1 exodeoxyribonuclease VII small subunit [Wenzhouxiangella marina]